MFVPEAVANLLRERGRTRIPLRRLRPASVAVPLVKSDQGHAVLFTVRADSVEEHKGEICFPGGRVEPGDRDGLAAALREAQEEVGIRPEDLCVLGPLDDFVSVSGYRVTPYVVYLPQAGYPFVRQPAEVADILLIPLEHLQDPSHHRRERRSDRANAVHCYEWGSHIVWGLTAEILKDLLDLTIDLEGDT